MDSRIEIEYIDTSDRRAFNRFVQVQRGLYRFDPHSVLQLIVDLRESFSDKRNPHSDHIEKQAFFAITNGAPAGRIVAYEDLRYNESKDNRIGFFGDFESIDDPYVARALFNAASAWLLQRGITAMRGPVNIAPFNDTAGLLVEGFTSPPLVGTPYNFEYYPGLFDQHGFAQTYDYYAYYSEVSNDMPEAVRSVAERTLRDPRLLVRRPDMKRFESEIERLLPLFSEMLPAEYGRSVVVGPEIKKLTGEFLSAIDPSVTYIAEYDGKPVGLSLAFVDMNRATKPARGRLFPFGILNMLIKKRTIGWCRFPVLAVSESHRNGGIAATLFYKSMSEGYKRGYRHAEISPVAASSPSMRPTFEELNLVVYKTYRLYEAPLL